MAPKQLRVHSDNWLNDVLYLLLNAPTQQLHESVLYEKTQTVRTDQSDSIIFEHPSLISSMDGVIRFSPFCIVSDQKSLLQMLQDAFPVGYRRVDLQGLYDFVDADLDELIFRKRVILVDATTHAVVAPRAPLLENALLKERWKCLKTKE